VATASSEPRHCDSDIPYAVVATVESDESPWDGLPVFSAWVAEPENADAD
jgi:hypothetical protein